MKAFFSPDIIFCGCLCLKHPLTNYLFLFVVSFFLLLRLLFSSPPLPTSSAAAAVACCIRFMFPTGGGIQFSVTTAWCIIILYYLWHQVLRLLPGMSSLLMCTLPVHSSAFFPKPLKRKKIHVRAPANTGSCVGPQNNIGHLAECRFPC